jgi:hypothetical protein
VPSPSPAGPPRAPRLKCDPLYSVRRALPSGAGLLTDKQIDRLAALFADGAHADVITLGRTLRRRVADVLAYFDRAGTSNGPTEAINGRLEHLRGPWLGFRYLTNYIARSPLDRGIQAATTPSIVKSPPTRPVVRRQIKGHPRSP